MLTLDEFRLAFINKGIAFEDGVLSIDMGGAAIKIIAPRFLLDIDDIKFLIEDIANYTWNRLLDNLDNSIWYAAYAVYLERFVDSVIAKHSNNQPELLNYRQFIIYLSFAADYFVDEQKIEYFIDSVNYTIHPNDSADEFLKSVRNAAMKQPVSDEIKCSLASLYDAYVNDWISRYYDGEHKALVPNNVELSFGSFIKLAEFNSEIGDDVITIDLPAFTITSMLDYNLGDNPEIVIRKELFENPLSYTCLLNAYELYVQKLHKK